MHVRLGLVCLVVLSSAPSSAEEIAVLGDGVRKPGSLVRTVPGEFSFKPADGSAAIPPAKIRHIEFTDQSSDQLVDPPFHASLGGNLRISGRLTEITRERVRMEVGPDRQSVVIARSGVPAIVQTPGESEVLHDSFESLDAKTWQISGKPRVSAAARAEGEFGLELPAGGCSITHRFTDPPASGRVEFAFRDEAAVVPNQRWYVEFVFRGGINGLQTVRISLGWSETSLAVETPDGPTLSIQRLARVRGWRRFVARFGRDRTAISVDSNELAYGSAPAGPLVEIKFGAQPLVEGGGGAGVNPPVARVDELSVFRLAEPGGGQEIDLSQDELRGIEGDQLFGSLESASPKGIRFEVAGSLQTYPWSEISGIHFRRTAGAGADLSGFWAVVEWRVASGEDSRSADRIEGVIESVDDRSIVIAAPYVAKIAVPRSRMKRLEVLGPMRRLVVDNGPHHLGDELFPDLFPPTPEGPALEVPFDSPARAFRRPVLALDVLQVVGVEGNPAFSDRVKRGELRTKLLLNGKEFDCINRYIFDKNERVTRIRASIEPGLLKPGRNVIGFKQEGSESNRGGYDDLGIISIAVEGAPEDH